MNLAEKYYKDESPLEHESGGDQSNDEWKLESSQTPMTSSEISV